MVFEDCKKDWDLREDGKFDRKKFVQDGIICPEKWNSDEVKEKILFILKEPNDEQAVPAEGGGTDLAVSLKETENINGLVTWRNINNWAYGLLNTNAEGPIPTWNEAKQAKERSLDKVAAINLKKLYGGSYVVEKELRDFAKKDADFILSQIEEINPDIIVTCNNMYLLEKYIIPKENLFEIDLDKYLSSNLNSKEWVNIWRFYNRKTKSQKDILIIRHYHPAATQINNKGFKEETKYNMCCEIKRAYLNSIIVSENNAKLQ